MTDDKLMREAFQKWARISGYDLSVYGNSAPEGFEDMYTNAATLNAVYGWDAAVRATAMECARICEHVSAKRGRKGATCNAVTEAIRARFGLED